jgi:hypothetical protein
MQTTWSVSNRLTFPSCYADVCHLTLDTSVFLFSSRIHPRTILSMSAFATLSLDDATEERSFNATTSPAPSPMDENDFKVHLALILTCSYELQDLLESRSCRENATIRAESLGEAIRAVSWTADAFKYLLTIHKQDVPLVLEAIQMVRLPSQKKCLYSFLKLRKYLDHSSPLHPFRRGATHLIIKIADRSGHLPRSLYVEDIESLQDHQSHGQGGYADVYKAFHNDEFIAIKRPRLIGGSELAHKVECHSCIVAESNNLSFRGYAVRHWSGVSSNIQIFCRSSA